MITSTSQHASVILDPVLATRVAHELMKVGAVQLNVDQPFTWVSGIQSPVYCDNRRINSFVQSRNIVADAFVRLIRDHFPQTEVIAGVATGGIPMGILVADRLKLPFVYVRQAPKEHGLKRQVEGECATGSKVVLIEDHVSTGGSSLNAIEGLWKEHLDLLALISIMTYNFPAAINLFKEHQVKHISLCDLDTVLKVAGEEQTIPSQQIESIFSFRDNPKEWRR